MQSPSKIRLLAPAALVAMLGLPPAVSAQYWLPPITTVAKADSLHAAAVAMADDIHRLHDAASLHRQSAALRPAEDSMGYRCLTHAAQLSFVVDELADAQADMTQAAAQALARGDVERAAQAYADAAWVANERKKPDQVWKLGRQAEILASSPLLDPMQRQAILGRFTHTQRNLAANREP